MKKRILRVLAVLFLLLILLMALVPIVFRSDIGGLIKRNVNNSITGTLDFGDSGLNLFRNFPNASFNLEDIVLTTAAPFEGDTLLIAGNAGLTMSIWELFKSQEKPINVKSLFIEDASLFLKVDENKNANYDIALKDDAADDTTGFTFSLEGYTISSSNVYYLNRDTDIALQVLDIEHEGDGDLSLDDTQLNTQTEALVSFTMDNTAYLSKNRVSLDALIGIDFNEQRYTFLENKAFINQLPLVFDGYVQIFDDYDQVAISFKTPDSDFKNFLAVIPEAYAQNIKSVETSGTFQVDGNLTGRIDEKYIPKFLIGINSENASFKFPELPKAVRNIQIGAQIVNETGIAEDTYISIDNVSFAIDGRIFNLSSRISNLLGNTSVETKVKGILDLANLEKVYPLEDFKDLKGLLDADVSAQFDMEAIENNRYERIKSSGSMELKGFEYLSPELSEPLNIREMQLQFSPQKARLQTMKGTMGESDFNVTGDIVNILGYLFNEEDLKGTFNLRSNTLNLDDFVLDQTINNTPSDGTGTVPSGLNIPSFINCTVTTEIGTVRYDNLELTGVNGALRIKDQAAGLYGMNASLLGGSLAFEGEVSAAGAIPQFSMKLNLADLGISRSFENIKLLRVLAPVAKALEGKLTSELAVEGALLEDLNLDYNSLTGAALAELTTTELRPGSAKILNAIAGKLQFLKPDNFNLKALKTALAFEDGVVKVAPFTFDYEEIEIVVEGGHTFDSALDYNITMEVPAKYLGTEVNSLIDKIGDPELTALTIPVVAGVEGPYSSPKVTTDLAGGVKDLTSRLVALQKQKLIDKGTDKTKELLEGIVNRNPKDSTRAADTTGTEVRDVVRDIFKRTGTQDTTEIKTDTTTGNVVKKTARNVLGGLLGRKKDTARTETDSIR